MRISKWLIAAAALCLLPTVSFAQFVNGGFEPTSPVASYVRLLEGVTDIPGWTTRYSGVEWWDPSAYGAYPSFDGGYCVNLAVNRGAISQTITTVPGQLYNVEFYVGTSKSGGRDGTCQIMVSSDTGPWPTITHSTTSLLMDWTQKTYSFIATGTSNTIRFSNVEDPAKHNAYIDGVHFATPLPVEPSTWGAVKALFR